VEPMQRKEVSYWLLIYKGQGTSSSLFGNGASNLVEVYNWQEVGRLDLDVTENWIRKVPQKSLKR